MYEGRAMADRLARLNVPVELFTDAALMASLTQANVVLLGCDAVFPSTFVNKVGTHALLRTARAARVPAFVIADSFKFLPRSRQTAFRICEESAAEVWRRKRAHLLVRNFYFEHIPLRLLSGVVTEDGVRDPREVALDARKMTSGAALRYARKRPGKPSPNK
jgi:translation initiation factor 2B subunit (eIF-2B alpha/beta/delta family)